MALLPFSFCRGSPLKGPPRIFLSPSAFSPGQVELDSDTEHYLRRVLRKKAGEEVVLLDGQDRSWLCELGGKGQARFVEECPSVAPLKLELTVGLALCKGSRFEGALEKLAELGVDRLIPVLTERTERKLPSASKQKRWSEIARSASALAGRLRPLLVDPPTPLSDCPAESVLCHPSGQCASELFGNWNSSGLILLVGPEGGFSPEEVSRFELQLALGPRNLRVETAAVSAATLAIALAAKGM